MRFRFAALLMALISGACGGGLAAPTSTPSAPSALALSLQYSLTPDGGSIGLKSGSTLTLGVRGVTGASVAILSGRIELKDAQNATSLSFTVPASESGHLSMDLVWAGESVAKRMTIHLTLRYSNGETRDFETTINL